ncbi:hypothetical protein ACQYRI_16475 [Salmonella enterica]
MKEWLRGVLRSLSVLRLQLSSLNLSLTPPSCPCSADLKPFTFVRVRILIRQVDVAGHFLGHQTWTFNAAGLNSGTVEKYGGHFIGDGSAISAYRVSGEVLTTVQEISFDNLANANFDLSSPALAMKAGVSNMFPDAIGKAKELSGGTGWPWDKHAMSQVIDCIEAQKDEDIGIIKNRL